MQNADLHLTAEGHSGERSFRWILLGILLWGLCLRLIVYKFLSPHNNDPHWQIIQFFLSRNRLPRTDELWESFQPPLYYFLAASIAKLGSRSVQIVQFFSVCLSALNFILIYCFLRENSLSLSNAARLHALAFVAFLPQFVLFGSFVSNDSLTFLLATIVTLFTLAMAREPSCRRIFFVSVALGIGLLTKVTFLVFIPPALIALIFALRLKKERTASILKIAVLSLSLTAILGCYKFVENEMYLGRAVVTYLDLHPGVLDAQKIQAPKRIAFTDVNLARLIRSPYWGRATTQSAWLPLYGTFYTDYISESNFTAIRRLELISIPRSLYLFGVVPILLMFLSMGDIAKRTMMWIVQRDPQTEERELLREVTVLLLVCANVAMVLLLGCRYYVTSSFQGRYLFPSILGLAILFGIGFDLLGRRWWLSKTLSISLMVLYCFFHIYFFIEITERGNVVLWDP